MSVFFYCYMREVIPEFISGDFRSCLFLVRVVSLIFCLMSSDNNWHVLCFLECGVCLLA